MKAEVGNERLSCVSYLHTSLVCCNNWEASENMYSQVHKCLHLRLASSLDIW
jgi:hypothetical protein